MSQIQQNLRTRRLELKLSQERLARKADLSTATVYKIEQGYRTADGIPFGTLRKLAGALGCTIDDLVGDAEEHDDEDCRQLGWQREAADALVGLPGVTPRMLLVFRTMASHVDHDGELRVTQVQLAREVGVAERELRRRYLAPLAALGAIERLVPGNGRGNRTLWAIRNLAQLEAVGEG